MKQSLLYQQYKEQVIPALQKQFGWSNMMQVPRVTKVTLNVGYGRHAKEKAVIDTVTQTLRAITGQEPVHQKAKKSISNFKIREGMPIAASVTLRGRFMYEFLYKLIHVVLPRVRDFRGLNSKSFDGQGNYSIGLKENIAFPEVTTSTLDQVHGVEITVATTAHTAEEGKALLSALGFPFRK